jgi:hypothetical protein
MYLLTLLLIVGQWCPTVVIRSPQLWQINMAIRQYSDNIAKKVNKVSQNWYQKELKLQKYKFRLYQDIILRREEKIEKLSFFPQNKIV